MAGPPDSPVDPPAEVQRLRGRLAELQAEAAALRESERQARALIDRSPIGVYRTTPDGRILHANPAMVRMLGYASFEELAERNLEQDGFEPEYPRGEFRQRIERDGSITGMEAAWRRRDGSTLFVREHAAAVRDAEGRVQYYEGTVEDITQRKQAEDELRRHRDRLEELVGHRTAELTELNRRLERELAERGQIEATLRQREQQYRDLAENSNDIVYHADAQGRVTYVGPQVERYGLSREQIVGRPITEVIDLEDRAAVVADFQRTLATGEEFPTEFRIRIADGGTVWLEDRGRVQRDASGTIIGITGVLRDVSDRRRAEDRLRASEQQAQALLNASTESVFLTDAEGRIVMLNATAAARLGRPAEQLIGVGPAELLPAELAEARMRQHRRVVDTGRPLRYEDRRDGQWFDTHVYPVFDAHGAVDRLAVFARDITEQRRAQQALVASERLYRTTIDAIAIPVHVVDADLRVLVFNAAFRRWCERLGLPAAVVGHPLFEVFPFLSDAVREEYRQVFATGRSLFSEDRVGVGDRVFVTETHKAPVVADGRVVRVITAVNDVTARQQAIAALAESERKYRELVENINDVIFSVDREGRITFISPIAEGLTGYGVDAFIGRQFQEFVHPADVERLRARFAAAMDGQAIQDEFRFLTRGGEVRWARTSSRPIRDEGGGIVGLQGVFAEITDRKRAEQALRDSEEKYRTLVESADQAISLQDESGVFLFLNATAARWLGGRPGDFIGKTMWELFPRGVADRQAAVVRQVIRSGTAATDEALTEIQGRRLWFRTSVQPVRDHAGRVRTALVIAADVTERRRTEEDLDRLSRQLIDGQENERARLSRELHDEAGQALTAIKLNANLLAAELPDGPPGCRQRARDIAGVAGELIDNIRQLSRWLRPSVLDDLGLVPAIRWCCDNARERMGIRVALSTRGLGDRLDGSVEVALFRIVQEALTNVARHADARQVDVELVREDRDVRLTVRDDGRGMDPAKACEGLGLLGIRYRARQCGGAASIAGEPGGGTTLSVRVPFHPQRR